MSTKGRNRQKDRRRQRRVLNQCRDFFGKVSGKFLGRIGYGSGLAKGDLKELPKNNKED